MSLLLLLFGFVWPLRPSSQYRPQKPVNSWRRTGYGRPSTYNRYGWHQATDFDFGPNGIIVQLPYTSKIVWKGTYGDLGRVIEVQMLEGPWKYKYMRFCHLQSYTSKPLGVKVFRGGGVARADNTGRSSGTHLHIEIGKYRLRTARFPKFDFFSEALKAFTTKRWAA